VTDRELRLRLRIDRLLDRVDQLEQTIAERDATIAALDAKRRRSNGRISWFRHSRDYWRLRALQAKR